MLEEKRKELGDAANKLRNGLGKLVDTKQKVEAMSVELEQTKAQLAVFQKECDDYLVIIVQQKRDAEEQEKTVAARSVKIAEEEAKCLVLADAAQKDLDEAMPALEEAVKVSSLKMCPFLPPSLPLFLPLSLPSSFPPSLPPPPPRLWKLSTRKIWGRSKPTQNLQSLSRLY